MQYLNTMKAGRILDDVSYSIGDVLDVTERRARLNVQYGTPKLYYVNDIRVIINKQMNHLV